MTLSLSRAPIALGNSVLSQEKVELVRQEIAARQARSWIDLSEFWHPEIEWNVVRGQCFRGMDEIVGYIDMLSELLGGYTVEADEVIDAGEEVVTVERIKGQGLQGNNSNDCLEEVLFRVVGFTDAKISSVTEYPTRHKALIATRENMTFRT